MMIASKTEAALHRCTAIDRLSVTYSIDFTSSDCIFILLRYS